jgi:DNA (cytosine-5)-methyltransferase 1
VRYGSVCSGIEAATQAWHTLGWVPAFFSEIDKFPSAVLAHHYGSNMPGEPLAKNGIPNYGDFTQIGPEAGPVDLLVGGTPCQSFSVAGKRLGLDDPRGNLALEYLSLARRLRARWIVWENVPGVLSSYSGSEQAAREVSEGPVGGEGNGIEDRDFAMFLSFVRECGYGFAYRVLDAQYIRVDGLARAVPQRRERVFLVGYLGDWRPAAAVLFEPEGMRGDSAPSRKAGQRTAGTIDASAARSRGAGISPSMITSTGSVAHCLNAGGMGRIDYETETMIAHSLRADGFDASEDRTGRGTPIVPIAFDTTQITSRLNRSVPKAGDPCHPLASGAHAPAIAIQAGALRENPNSGPDGVGVQAGIAYTVEARSEVQAVCHPTCEIAGTLCAEDSPHGARGLSGLQTMLSGYIQPVKAASWAVRRLTPKECERLQGFPDGFTDVPYRGKQAADGPRYKALGNSMAVNAMRWIGQRIDIMEAILEAERAAA